MSEEQKNNAPLIGEIFVEGEAPPQYYQAFLNAQAKAEEAAAQAEEAAGRAEAAAEQIEVDQEFIATQVFAAGGSAEAAAGAAHDAAESKQNAKDAADRAEAAAERAESAGGGGGGGSAEGAVLYTPQDLTEEQQAQARENIGASTYYHTTREKVGKAHTDANWAEYIWGLYRALPGVIENEVKNNAGTFTNYEYVISTGEYSTDGKIAQAHSPDLDIKKPKYLILTGYHGMERNAALSVYRFIRDVINGHNVPQSFKEGVIIHVMPVGNPASFDAFTYVKTSCSDETTEKEGQAIVNWLKANDDADLFIDLHNGSALNEIVAICGDSSYETAKTAKKIALKGIDRIIPFWREVIGYPADVEVITDYERNNGIYTNIQLGNKPIIFSYCADTKSSTSAFGYAITVLSIPSVAIEYHDYYGDYSEYNPTLTIPQPVETYPNDTPGTIEAIAAGAEAIGNILLEFYEQSFMGEVVDDMKAMDSKLDSLLAQVNSGFHSVSGVVTLEADILPSSGTGAANLMEFKVPCPSGAKLIIFEADEDTFALIQNKTSGYYCVNASCTFVDDLTGTERNGFMTGWVAASNKVAYGGIAATNEDGCTLNIYGLVAGRYRWTAYYWND